MPAFVVRDTANIAHEDPRAAGELDRTLAARYRLAFANGTRSVYERVTPESP
jgi:hypothetical protein